MKIQKIILRDRADTLFDDLITFDKEIEREDIIIAIEKVKEQGDYTNEDICKELAKLGNYTLEWIGNYEIFEY